MSQPVWYLLHEGTQHGPISDAELHALAATGRLLQDDLIWKPGFPQWQLANTIPNLLSPPPPPNVQEPILAAASSEAPATPSRLGISWILLACLGISLVVLSEGMMRNPNELDSNLGLGVRIVATALIFALLHWRKGWFPKDPQRSARSLGWIFILFGAFSVASFVFLLWLVADTPLGPWLMVFTVAGITLVVVGTALLMKKNWARMAGNVLVFVVAFGWPTGFAHCVLRVVGSGEDSSKQHSCGRMTVIRVRQEFPMTTSVEIYRVPERTTPTDVGRAYHSLGATEETKLLLDLRPDHRIEWSPDEVPPLWAAQGGKPDPQLDGLRDPRFVLARLDVSAASELGLSPGWYHTRLSPEEARALKRAA